MSDDLEIVSLLPGYERLTRDSSGKWKLRYRATDPLVSVFKCTCGKSECGINKLVPFREHVKMLCKAIIQCEALGFLQESALEKASWEGVIYPLQMAASLEDVFADPSFIDDSAAEMYCSSVWDRNEIDRDSSSKYMAALIIFNFIWMAYESAVEVSSNGEFKKDAIAVRGRNILNNERMRISELPYFEKIYRVARYWCASNIRLKRSINEFEEKYNIHYGAASAELVRIFRNYIIHGDDIGGALQ